MQATELARGIAAREISPVEVLERALLRAEHWDLVSNVFSMLHAEQAQEVARVRQEEAARGEPRGPLHGVPVAVKDLFDVEGWETTGCCRAYRGAVAERDAAVVARLRAAGAVIVGKTNMHELAAGGTNAVSACGACRNPWDPSRISGGSSGGSAAAVGARVVPLALGTDTGGSVRIPASMCGTVGLKTTFGSLDMMGVMPLTRTLDTVGPLTMTVEDAALGLAVIAGRGQRFVDETASPPQGLRVAVPGAFFAERARRDVLAAVHEARDVLIGMGGRPATGEVGHIGYANDAWINIAWPEFAADHGLLLRRPESLYPLTRRALERGSTQPAVEMVRAQRDVARLRAAFDEALAEADVLVAPATPFPAPRFEEEEIDVGSGPPHGLHTGGPAWFTRVVNLVGLPALSLPAGFSDEGLPLGVQLIGRAGEEASLLRLGRAFQRATDHHLREPKARSADG
ncbi:MAG TPA: amidase [Actinomycetota bacterium]